MLVVNKLNKYYGDFHALQDVSLSVDSGNVHCLLGPNGSGKSTLMNILSSLFTMHSGDIVLNGCSMHDDIAKYKSQIAFLHQDLFVDVFLTPYETVLSYTGLRGNRCSHSEIEYYLTELGIKEKMHAQVRSLSGGMRRITMTASVIASKPKLLIIDEPTSGLDRKNKERVWNFIKNMQKEHGMSVLLATHDFEEADYLADSVTAIRKGCVIATGKTHEVFKHMDINVKIELGFNASDAEKVKQIFTGFKFNIKDNGIVIFSDNVMHVMKHMVSSGIDFSSVIINHPSISDIYDNCF